MSKIQVKIYKNAAKENLMFKEEFTTRDGEKVQKDVILFDLIPMKEESRKVIYSHEKFDLVKTHFAVKRQTKEEREAKAESIFVGEGITQIWKEDASSSGGGGSYTAQSNDDEEDDLPF